MKINKKLIILSVILIPILAMGSTLAYSASLNKANTSLTQLSMNPFEFIDNCQASGGLVFAWDNGYGCDFLDDYDIICDNSGVCSEGFVAESNPQNSEVAGVIFDVGLHANSSTESISSVIQNIPLPQMGDVYKEEEQTSDDPSNENVIKAYCESIGGTYIEEANRLGCDLPGEDIFWCTKGESCSLEELKSLGESNQTSFGTMTPVDATLLHLFILKPGNTQFSMLAGSNQLYNNLAVQVADGYPAIIVTANNFGIFQLKSKWGIHGYEGLMFPITELSYLLPDLSEQSSVSEIDVQIVEPESTEQVHPTVSPKQDMNCRYGPGTHYSYLTTFRVNTEAAVLGKNIAGDWYFVELDGGTRCWVWGNGLQDVSNLDNVVVITDTTDDSDSKEPSDEDEIPDTGGSDEGGAPDPPTLPPEPPITPDFPPPPPPCIGPWCEPINPGSGTAPPPPSVD